ncbi:uncharacterized protein LOC131669840 [Phymastichus coffea]|uniref:uncharacterized protein LOC131669840 n=1 Tax=Phymastichus coffea TaxID=108790 RepID=UPI00273AE23C|nr:uncharacterized protein LOC131669840 [Phymastichus coffea]
MFIYISLKYFFVIENNIVKEEVIIPDLIEENIDQNTYLDTSYSQIKENKSIKKENGILVSQKNKKKIHGSDNTFFIEQNTQLQAETLSTHDPIEITLEQCYNLSVLKLKNTPIPVILKLQNLKPIQNKTAIQISNIKKDNLIEHTLNTKDKHIINTGNNFTEMKEVIELDSEEQIATRNRRYYHVVCLTCKKLKQPNDSSNRCKDCQNIFQYECLRCRDLLSSKHEYFNHLKIKEFCPEIQVPLFLKNDSYALATMMERNQCSNNVWDRAQKLVSVVKIARKKSINGKFKRIKSCCPICDETYPVENGNFWCKTCDASSVFKCQTCNRNYTTYCGAIYHTENHVTKKLIFECHECSFKHKKKRALSTHIRHKHLQKEAEAKKPRNKKAQCPDCKLIITTNSYWRKHEYSCRKKIYFKCTLCTEKYLAREEIRLHLLVAHEKTDSQIFELIKKIEDNRNNQLEEKVKQRKQENTPQKHINIESSNKLKSRYITPYCIDCNKTYEHLRISNNNNCPKCKSIVQVQCKFCKKSFKKYMTAYYHIKKKCNKIKIAISIEKNSRLIRKKMTLGHSTMIMPIVLVEKLPLNFQNHSVAEEDASSSNASNDSDQILNHKSNKDFYCTRLRNKRKKRKKRLKTCKNNQAQPVSDNLRRINHNPLAIKTINKNYVAKTKAQKEKKVHLKSYGFNIMNKLTFREEYLNHLYTPIVVLERLSISHRTKPNIIEDKKRLKNIQEEKSRQLQEEKLKKAVEKERLRKVQEGERLKKIAEKEQLQKIQEEEDKKKIKELKLNKAVDKERLLKLQKEKKKKLIEEEKIKKVAKQERLQNVQEEEEQKRNEETNIQKDTEHERLWKIQEEEKRKIKEEKLKKTAEKERLQKLQIEQERKRTEEEKSKESGKQEKLKKLQEEEEEKRRLEEGKLKKATEQKRLQKLREEEEKKKLEQEKLKNIMEQKQPQKLREEDEKRKIEEEKLKKSAQEKQLGKLREDEEKKKINDEQLKNAVEQERMRKLEEEKEKVKAVEQARLKKLQEEEEKRKIEEKNLKKVVELEQLRKLQEEEEKQRTEEERQKKATEKERLQKLQEEEKKREIKENKLRQIAEQEKLQKLQKIEEKRKMLEENLKQEAEKERQKKLLEEKEKRSLEEKKLREVMEKERQQKLLKEETKRKSEDEKLKEAAEEVRLRQLCEEEKTKRIEEEKLIDSIEQECTQKLCEELEKKTEEEELRKAAEVQIPELYEEKKKKLKGEKLKKIVEKEHLQNEKTIQPNLTKEREREAQEEKILKIVDTQRLKIINEQEELKKAKLHKEEDRRTLEEQIKKIAEQEQLQKLQKEEIKRKIEEKESKKKAKKAEILKLKEEVRQKQFEEKILKKAAQLEELRLIEAQKRRIEEEKLRIVEEQAQKLREEEYKINIAELERLRLAEDAQKHIEEKKLKRVAEHKYLHLLRETEKKRIEEQKLRKAIEDETIRQNLKREQERVAETERLKRIAEEERIKKIIEKEKLKIIEEREILKKVIDEERSKTLADKQRSRKAIEKALLKKIADRDRFKVKLQIRKILTDSDRRTEDSHKVSESQSSENAIIGTENNHNVFEQEVSDVTINEKDNTEKSKNNLPDGVLNTIKIETMDDYGIVRKESNVIEQNDVNNYEQFNEDDSCLDHVDGSAYIKTESADNQEDECRSGSMTLQEACEQIANDNICEDNFESSNVCIAGLNSLLSIPNDSDDDALEAEMDGHVDNHFIAVNPRPFELNVSSALAKMFNCIKCGQFFKSERSLRDHTRCCMVPPYLECVFCFWKTNRKNTLRKHIKVKHKQECPEAHLEPLLVEIFKKSAPLRAIAERAALLDNTLLHNSKSLTLRCDECFETFVTKARLQKHIFKRHWRMPTEVQLHNQDEFVGAEIEDIDQIFTSEMITSDDPLEEQTLENHPDLKDRDDELPSLSKSPRSALVESTYGFVLPQETQNFVSQSVTCWCPTCDKWTSALEKYIKCQICDTPYIYGCKWCAQQKRNYQLSRIHVIRHHTERIHTCGYCGHNFSYIQDYRHHLKYCVKEKNIICPNANCLFKTKYQRSLKHHLLTCREAKDSRSTENLSNSRPLPELVPIMRVNNEDTIDDNRSNEKLEYRSKLGSQRKRQLNSSVLMENHIPRKKRELEPLPKLKFYLKKNCLENWTKNGSSSKHKHVKKTRSIIRRYHCYKCGKIYKSNNQLSRHMSCCVKVNMFVSCDHCSFKTVSKSTLVAHIHSKHAARLFRGIEAFNCVNCRQVFRNYFIYERHTDKCKKARF